MNLLIELIHEHILAIDFGMFVLIWLVQLIIYPVLDEVSIEKFSKWHEIYCRRIAFVVLPLMIAQLFEAAASCFFIGGGLEWGKLACVLAAAPSTRRPPSTWPPSSGYRRRPPRPSPLEPQRTGEPFA